MTKKQRYNLTRIIVTAVLTVLCVIFAPEEGWLRPVLFAVPYFLIGYDILLKAVQGIIHLQPFDENFLMAVATVGAIALAMIGRGDYLEAVGVMIFYQTGEWFQSYAVGRSRRSISALMDIRPDVAYVVGEDGTPVERDPEEVEVGSIIVVRPGEKIPLDGIVTDGTSALDTSALSGESLPCEVAVGDEVKGGCVNLNGVLHIRTTRPFGESTVAKILDLVENAGSRKSKSEHFISSFARIYTPAVCGAALVLAVLPPLVRLMLSLSPEWGEWIYRALTFLVISCPCALVISIPLTFFAGIGGASRAGILIKGSNYIEATSRLSQVVFDKTGTVTQGVFEVVGVHHSTLPDEQLLAYAALAESYSTHPISRSLRAACEGELDPSRVTDTQEIAGHGVKAVVDGHTVLVGNEKLMRREGLEPMPCHKAGTVVHVAVDGAYAGHILISDRVKPHAKEAMAALKACGIRQTVMLTGDNEKAAEAVAAEIGIDRVCAGLLPADKVSKVEELLAAQKPGEKLAFVGDGINDAPVLTRADVGIAMGGMGSDAAIEAADLVLMDDDPLKVSHAVALCRKCMRIVHENIIFALSVKAVCLVLGAVGVASMWVAIFADVGVMILAVLNALRALSAGKGIRTKAAR